MITMFLYGELSLLHNLESVIDDVIDSNEIENAVLEDYTLINNPQCMCVPIKSTLSTVNGILYNLEQEHVKALMAYYGKDFRLTAMTVKVGIAEREVKMFLNTNNHDLVGTTYNTPVKERIENFCYTYIADEAERDICNKTIAGLYPDYDTEWLKTQYPAYVKMLRDVCYAKEYLLDSLVDTEVSADTYINIMNPLFKRNNAALYSIVLDEYIPAPMPLDIANTIMNFWKFINSTSTVVTELLDLANIALKLKAETYDEALSILNKTSDGIVPALDCLEEKSADFNEWEFHAILFCILKSAKLPLVYLKDRRKKPLSAYVYNELYMNYLK